MLEVIGKLVHVLVVREESVGLSTVEVVVPDTEKGEDDGQVLVERGLLEVLVHLVSSGEHFSEVLGTDVEHDGETNGGPEGVSSTDPIPELKHVVRINSKLSNSLGVG